MNISEIIKELMLCPDCKGKGVRPCEHCDSHNCLRCHGDGKIYEFDPEKLLATFTSYRASIYKELIDAIEGAKRSHMDDPDYPHDDCIQVTIFNEGIEKAAQIIKQIQEGV